MKPSPTVNETVRSSNTLSSCVPLRDTSTLAPSFGFDHPSPLTNVRRMIL